MPGTRIPLGPSSEPGKSSNAGTSLLINCYVEAIQGNGGKTDYAIYSDPGLVLFSAIGGIGNIRGIFALGNLLYVVSGEKLYRVNSVGTATELGTVLGQSPVIFTSNRKQPENQITIVADQNVYTLTGSTLTEGITNLPAGCHSATFLQGRTIYGLNDGRYFPSDVNDSITIDPLRFAEAELDSDNGARVFANGDEFLYFGTRSLEIFRPTGDSDNPFAPLQGAGQGKGAGTISKTSVVVCDNTIFYANDIGQVVRLSGYQPQRISNHAVERDIQTAIDGGTTDLITAFAWSREGHWFYHLNLDEASWVYDAATKLWHKKESYLEDRSRIRYCAEAFNKIIVGDADGSSIFQMTPSAKDEAGEHLVTTVQSPMLHDYPNGGIINSFWVDCEMGVGTGTDPHSADPQLMAQITRDGGKTWTAPRMRPLGATGQYRGRIRYNKLGRFGTQGVAFRVSCSAPVNRAIFQAYADIEPLQAV